MHQLTTHQQLGESEWKVFLSPQKEVKTNRVFPLTQEV